MNDYTEQFNQERAKYRELGRKNKIVAKVSSPVLKKMMKAVEDKNLWVWPFAIGLAILNDFVDILIIGSIPLVGDIVDILTGFILFMFLLNLGGHIKMKVRAAIFVANFLELIPLVDFIPVWTICIFYAWYITNKKGKRAEEGLRNIKNKLKSEEIISEFS